MYENEKKKVLELLAEGKIDAITAENILDSLDSHNLKSDNNVAKEPTNKRLKIKIESAEGDDININIPLEFAKLLKNKNFNGKLNTSSINIDEIIEIASSGIDGEIINIESAEGEEIKITIE